MTQRQEIICLVLKYEDLLNARDEAYLRNTLEDNDDECEVREQELATFLQEYPGIVNYDDLGNYIGQVAYENGYTP